MSGYFPPFGRSAGTPSRAHRAFIIVAAALAVALASQWALSVLVPGSNYYGTDGRMAQSTILATFKFGQYFHVTNLSPIEGAGSQLLPKNVWINPAFWPFAWFEKEIATDISALIALAIFAGAVYVMMRCCDVPPLPGAMAMMGCLLLFAPVVTALRLPSNFLMTPGDAVAYAPYMVAFGLLARLRPGAWRAFLLTAGTISVLILYSICCDPLWTMVAAISWAVPFAVMTFSCRDRRTIALRLSALGCCFAIIVLSGAAIYLYTLSQYTARVQFAAVLDRTRGPELISALSFSWAMKYFYLASAIGWLAGLVTLRGRANALVIAAVAAFVTWLICVIVYVLLLNATWVIPIPRYVEQALVPLYLAAGLAGYWGALSRCAPLLARTGRPIVRRATRAVADRPFRWGVAAAALALLCAYAGLKAGRYGLDRIQTFAQAIHDPWVSEPELVDFLGRNTGLEVGRPFRGAVNFPSVDLPALDSLASLWAHGVPSLNEYSQLVTPEALYFVHALLKRDVRTHLNHFNMFWSEGVYTPAFWSALAALGVRYTAVPWRLPDNVNPGLALIMQSQRPLVPRQQPATWYVYELPHPNVGNYSPTEAVFARSGAEIMARLREPDFDFARQVVLAAPLAESLVPARDMRLSIIRGGLHVSGRSDGTSLVVLPQQFSHCLKARDPGVRFVRANLMMAGMIFAGDIDTDIVFDYGVFSPGCRRTDLADLKQLDLKIDLRAPHLTGERVFPTWDASMARLRAALAAIN